MRRNATHMATGRMKSVRVERRSHWYDPGRAGRRADAVRGDWTVHELVSYALAIR